MALLFFVLSGLVYIWVEIFISMSLFASGTYSLVFLIRPALYIFWITEFLRRRQISSLFTLLLITGGTIAYDIWRSISESNFHFMRGLSIFREGLLLTATFILYRQVKLSLVNYADDLKDQSFDMEDE